MALRVRIFFVRDSVLFLCQRDFGVQVFCFRPFALCKVPYFCATNFFLIIVFLILHYYFLIKKDEYFGVITVVYYSFVITHPYTAVC